MEPVLFAAGALLLLLGAVGATRAQRVLESTGRGRWVPLALVPYGVLIGGGAALIRGWALGWAMLVGALVVPVVGIVGRYVQVRRRARRTGRDG